MFQPVSHKPQPGMGVFPSDWLETTFMPTAIRKVTSASALRDVSLHYGEPKGDMSLRRALSQKLGTFNLQADPGQIITTIGATHALDIISRTVLRAGDCVMVEEPGWAVEFARLDALGMRILPVPRRADGPDLAVMAQAIPAWRESDLQRLAQLNDWVLQTRETSELRLQAEQMGRSLLDWLRNHDDANPAHIAACARMQPTYPVAFSLAASQTAAPVRDCLLAYAFGWAENMMQAAIKSVPLGQSAGQRILARLARDIPAAVEAALQLPDSERQAFSPMLAILSAQHETQYSRLFRS